MLSKYIIEELNELMVEVWYVEKNIEDLGFYFSIIFYSCMILSEIIFFNFYFLMRKMGE